MAKVSKPVWPVFIKALAEKDQELTEAEEKSSFEPPVGMYLCTIIGHSGTIFESDDGKSDYSIGVKYLINEGDFAGKEFYSQGYNFNEQGIGYTKAFVRTIAGLDEAPNTAQELADALDFAVTKHCLVHLEVKYRTYTTKRGDQKTVIAEKILEGLGASKPANVDETEANASATTKETISTEDVGTLEDVPIEDVPITVPA